ncbi:helix-turn-helix transcriptional regulator [Brevibacterium aurantiacum]|uniref:Helix-turn-helix domain-containing protein n=1 Tax=Brevibacterium aurantiacum TaxID=273384 RepID=A0A2A3ZD11_BREAU|nr:hypothetical protein CIK62_13520 [Brevibacterium aurantiacum]
MSENNSASLQPAVINDVQAAEYLGLTTSWLRNNRKSPSAPPFCKLGGRVRYRVESLNEWVRQQEVKY